MKYMSLGYYFENNCLSSKINGFLTTHNDKLALLKTETHFGWPDNNIETTILTFLHVIIIADHINIIDGYQKCMTF